jgi:signal transduction histidine kinase
MGGEIMSVVISTISIAIAIACVAVVIYYRQKAKRMLERMNHALDSAIAGNFTEDAYDESRLSQLEAKLCRFLASSTLSRNNVERERDKIKSLISDISHQTKTPVANILMYTELLLEQDDLPGNAKELTEQIRPQADKLNFLIQSLIKASRLEIGIVTVHPSPNDVAELMTRAAAENALKAESKQILLTVCASPGLSALFDPKWTAEALVNIIDNAVKYTPRGGQVTVSAAAYELFVRVDVRDTGIGIREADYPKLYERFWRSSSVSDVEGVGIGLYLAREIIAKQDGYIKVESAVGKGTLFSVFLPKA